MLYASTADDLLSLLAVVCNPNEITSCEADADAAVAKSSDTPIVHGDGHDGWQVVLAALSLHRREVCLELNRLALSIGKWASAGSGEDDGSLSLRTTLAEVESRAIAVRGSVSTYTCSTSDYKKKLGERWRPKDRTPRVGQISDLERIGLLLSSQLIDQLNWDEVLLSAVTTFLDDGLYTTSAKDGGADKLHLWSETMSKMLCIDHSLWRFVEREVFDETFRNDESPDFLNGEPSSEFVQREGATGDTFVKKDDNAEDEAALSSEISVCRSIEQAVEVFLLHGGRRRCVTSALLIGPDGCGKSHLLGGIQTRAHAMGDICVIKPEYPVDLVGSTIGSSEDRLISLFSFALRVISASENKGRKCIVMLDDIDKILSLLPTGDRHDTSVLGSYEGSTAQYYVGRRCKALFITLMDAMRDDPPCGKGGQLLILCTARSNCDEIKGRFDKVFNRDQPSDEERNFLITSCLGDEETSSPEVQDLVALVTKHSAGRSASELAQCCRQAVANCTGLLSRLQHLDRILQSRTPQSVRGGSLDGVVDMRVLTPDELTSRLKYSEEGEAVMPLLGTEAKRAFDELMNMVITPLCRSDEIRELLYGGGSSADALHDTKPIRVGALLSGTPGAGKTALAYHCASVAAKMARVTLLDVSCTSLIHKEIGGSERAVQRLFAAVRAAAPCLLLLDGIENVAPKRGNDTTTEGTMDRVLSTFLTEMDGVDTAGSNGNVGVIGITHNPDLIDPSLCRPGRLEKTIVLGPLDFEARKVLIHREIESVAFDFSGAGYFDAKNAQEVANSLAMESNGMTAMEIIAMCREASMICLRELDFELTVDQTPVMTQAHFRQALKTIRG